MSVELRKMAVQDIAAVHRLETELFPDDAWPIQAFEGELALSDTRNYWVYEDGGQVIGYAGLCTVLPISDVQTIAIDPAYQGQGLGRKMMNLMIDTAKERGALDVMLEVRFDNPTAINLYESLGFITIHRRPRYYKGGIDALIMRLQLEKEAQQ